MNEPWGEDAYKNSAGMIEREVTHLVLAEVTRFANPVPARGALGLWHAPSAGVDVMAAVSAEMVAAGLTS